MRRGVVQGLLAAGLIVSVILNLFLWSGRQEQLSSAEKSRPVSPKKSAPVSKPEVQSSPILLRSVTYSRKQEAVLVRFSGHDAISCKNLQAHLSSEPQLPLSVRPDEWNNSGFLLSGNFVCGREYLFKIRKGLRDDRQGELKRDLFFSVRIPDRSPRGRILTGGLYFPWQSSSWILPVELINTENLVVQIQRCHDSNLNPFGLADDWQTREYRKTILNRKLKISCVKNKEMIYPLDLRKLLPACRPGAYAVELCHMDEDGTEWRLDSRMFFVTDLGITAAGNDLQKRIEFFVRRLSDGGAVAGAAVSLYSYQKQLLGTVRTDENGHGFFDREVYQTGGEDRPKMLMAVSGKDINILELGGDQHDLSEFGNTGKFFTLNGVRTFLYTEREIYRNDEKVFYRGLARMYQEGVSRILKNAPLILVLSDPLDTVLWERRVQTNSWGALEGEFQLPSGAMAGYYSLTCRIPEEKTESQGGFCQFRVGDFVPDRLKVDIQPERKLLLAGESLNWKSSAKYYFGPSAEHCTAGFMVQVSEAEFPLHWKGYAVGNLSAFRPAVLHKENRRDYRDGDLFRYTYDEEFNQPVLLTGILSVAEPGGRSVSHSSTVLQLKTQDYLGLKYRAADSDLRDAVICARFLEYDPARKKEAAVSRKVDFKLYCLNWRYVLKQNGGRFRREWIQEKNSCPAPEKMTLGEAEKSMILKNLPAGYYELEARTDSHFTVLNFWHAAGGSTVRSSNPNVLVLETDRREYSPGETAQVMLDCPEQGQVMAFCGEIGLEDVRSWAVQPGRNTLRIPIPDTFETDRYFCGVTLVYGKDGRHRLFSLLRLKINQSARRLKVKMETPEQYRPGQRIPVKIALTDYQGQSAAGFVQLFAVDEGILSLTDYQVPDPFAFFYQNFYCVTDFFDTYGKFYPEISLQGSGRIGGDRGRLRKARQKGGLEFRHKKSAVTVLAGQAVQAGQTAEFSLLLPEHSGAMRLMAVAMNEQGTGSGAEKLMLRHPMTILGSMPAKLAAGDEFDITLNAFNHEFPKSSFLLKVELPEGVTALGKTEQKLVLEQKDSGIAVIRCRAEKAAGNQVVKIVLQHGTAVIRDELYVQIRELVLPETRTELKMLQPGEKTVFAGTAGGRGTAALQIMPSPLLGVREALDWLNDYPYGCTEQITSGAFPLLAAEKMHRAGLISKQDVLNARDKIFLVCNDLMGRRLASGGFSAWPGAQEEWAEAGIYAAHFLFLAQRKGCYKLGRGSRYSIQGNLERLLFDEDREPLLRAYALYVLAVSGEKYVNAARNFLLQGEGLVRVLAAAALYECGYAREAVGPLQAALDSRCWLGDGSSGALSGRAARLGMILTMVSDILPEDDRLLELVRLMQSYYQGGGRGWGNTHENAWACYGLMQVPQLQQEQSVLPEVHLGFADGGSRNFHQSEAMIVEKGFPVTVTNTGKVPVYLQQTVTGVLRSKPETIQDRGLKIRRVYMDAAGREVTRVNHGDLVTVGITLESAQNLADLALADILPGGLVIEDGRLASRALAVPGAVAAGYDGLYPRYMEQGEDRLLLFGSLSGGRKVVFSYQCRAAVPGRFVVPPCQAEDMYESGIIGQDGGGGIFEIR